MKPIKITIQGSYLDCQIYRGWLYLWTFDGKLCVYRWSDLVDSLVENEADKLAFKFSFKDGNYLYKSSLMELFCDSDFMSLLRQKFQKIENYRLQISEKHLKDFLIAEMDTPSNALPIDTEIYNSILYYSTEEGLFKTNAHKKEGYPVSTKPSKIWDARVLSLKANRYPQMALSAGDDGLYEIATGNNNDDFTGLTKVETNIHRVSELHSSFANYSNLSIYSSSLSGKSYLAMFNLTESVFGFNTAKRDYSKEIDSSEIFGEESDELSWGVDRKIFRVNKNGFNIVSFDNFNEDAMFTKRDGFKQSLKKSKIIGGASAYFGNIVEFENGLSVIQTDGQSLTINQPVTRWRIYPRSINYENQLHVLLDNKMEIYAFNHDYFIPQYNKLLGLDYREIDKRRNY